MVDDTVTPGGATLPRPQVKRQHQSPTFPANPRGYLTPFENMTGWQKELYRMDPRAYRQVEREVDEWMAAHPKREKVEVQP